MTNRVPKPPASTRVSCGSRPGIRSPLFERDNPLNEVLEHEVLAETAATYARLLEKLDAALAALREFEARVDLPLLDDPRASGSGRREGSLAGRRPFGLASPAAPAAAASGNRSYGSVGPGRSMGRNFLRSSHTGSAASPPMTPET